MKKGAQSHPWGNAECRMQNVEWLSEDAQSLPQASFKSAAGCAGSRLPLDLIPLLGGGAAEEAGAVKLFVAEGGHGLDGRGAAGGDVAGEEGGNRQA